MQLSIDVRLQYILHEELQRVVDDFTAKGGAGLIMNVNTGEVLAMVSLPDFDPNHPGAPDPAHPECRSPTGCSTGSPSATTRSARCSRSSTTAMALDSGATTMTGTL